MPDVARFFNVDPLAEDYPHNSTYAFSENRVIDNIELEGLEGEDFRFRLNQRLKGGVQARVEASAQKDASDSFMAVVRTVTPMEEIYSLFSGKDFDGNAVSTGDALSMLSLNLIPEVKVEAKAASIVAKAEIKAEAKAEAKLTSNSARREAMRQEGIPTSQQPKSQSKNASGREYSYHVPKKGGGTETKSVQQQTMDKSHKGEPHWEAGKVKTDNGTVRMNNYNRPKLENNKSKVNY